MSIRAGLWTVAILSFVLALIVVGVYVAQFSGPLSVDPASWGQFGDYVGGILNPAFGLMALIAILVTVYLQSSTLRVTSKELALSRKELVLSRTEFRRAAEAQVKSQEALDRQVEVMIRAARVSGYGALMNAQSSELARVEANKIGKSPGVEMLATAELLRVEMDLLLDVLRDESDE